MKRFISHVLIPVLAWSAPSIPGLGPSVLAQRIGMDGLHGNLLFHDGKGFTEPLITKVLSGWSVDLVGPFGTRFEPGMRLSARGLEAYQVLIVYLPADEFSRAETITAVARNAVAWLAGQRPAADWPVTAHPLPTDDEMDRRIRQWTERIRYRDGRSVA